MWSVGWVASTHVGYLASRGGPRSPGVRGRGCGPDLQSLPPTGWALASRTLQGPVIIIYSADCINIVHVSSARLLMRSLRHKVVLRLHSRSEIV